MTKAEIILMLEVYYIDPEKLKKFLEDELKLIKEES